MAAGPDFSPFNRATKTPSPAGIPLIFSETALSLAESPPSSLPPFSLSLCCHFSKVPSFFLLRQRNSSVLTRARPTKPPTTPPAIGATFVEPLTGIVKLPLSVVPVSGAMIPAAPPLERLVSVGCDNMGWPPSKESLDSIDCVGVEDENTGTETSDTAEDATGTSAVIELVDDAAAGLESELAGAAVADGVDIGSAVVPTSGTGAGTAAAGACGGGSEDCAAVEEIALVVPIAEETAAVDVA